MEDNFIKKFEKFYTKNKTYYDKIGDIDIQGFNFDFNTFTNMIDKTYVDTSFQRDGGWDEERQFEFLSLFKTLGSMLCPIYICQIESCYKNAEDEETKSYFFELMNKGYTWLSVDGNNRSISINLSKSIMSTDKMITISIIKKIKKSSLPMIFNFLNNSLGQSSQTMRNTLSYYLTTEVVKITKSLKSVYLFVKSKKAINSKSHEEMITRCLMICDNYNKNKNILKEDELYKIGLTKTTMNRFAKSNSDKLILHKETIRMTTSILERMDRMLLKEKSLISELKNGGQVYFLNLFMILLFKYRTEKIDESELLKVFIKSELLLRRTDSSYMSDCRENGKRCVGDRFSKILGTVVELEKMFLPMELAV